MALLVTREDCLDRVVFTFSRESLSIFHCVVYSRCVRRVFAVSPWLAYRTILRELAVPNHISPTSPWSRKLSSSWAYAFSQLQEIRQAKAASDAQWTLYDHGMWYYLQFESAQIRWCQFLAFVLCHNFIAILSAWLSYDRSDMGQISSRQMPIVSFNHVVI